MPGRSKAAPESQSEAFLFDACPLMRKFHIKMADATMGKPVLDIGCGSGRNASPLAANGCTVICADKDLSRFHSPKDLEGQLIPRQMDFVTDAWLFAPSSAGGIVSVHFLLPDLLPHFKESLSRGAYLLLETVPGCGGNYLQLPQKGQLRSLLEDSFDLEFYKERNVGPQGCGAGRASNTYAQLPAFPVWKLGLLISEHALLWTNGVSLRRAGSRQFRRVEAFYLLDHKTGVARLNKKTARRFVFQNVIDWRRPVCSSSAYESQRDFTACPGCDQCIGARRAGGTWLEEN